MSRIAETNDQVIALGCRQREALTKVVMRMADFLRRHEKQVREHERLLVDGIDADAKLVIGLGGVDVNLGSWIAGVLGSAGAAAGAGAGVTAVAGTFGVAGQRALRSLGFPAPRRRVRCWPGSAVGPSRRTEAAWP